MTRRTLRLFMWGYQEHFRSQIRSCATEVLAWIGAPSEVEVLLVGVRRPGDGAPHPVCIEPEHGRWALNLFDSLEDDVADAIPKHSLSRTFFGDEASMRDKPEWTRQAVVAEQVRACLAADDAAHDRVSFVRAPAPIGGYDIAVVIQVPKATLAAHPQVQARSWEGEPFDTSLIHACMAQVLDVAESQLVRPDPGRSRREDIPETREITRRAARTYMRFVTTLVDPKVIGRGPYDALTEVATLRYEGDEGLGRMLLVAKDTSVNFVVELETPVRLTEARWIRKLLEMSTADLPLIATWEGAFGLGRLSDPDGQAIVIDFHGHQDWEVRWADSLLMRSRLGEARLPQEALPEARFRDNVARLFPQTTPADHTRLWEILCRQSRQPHGSLVVIAADAAAEAERLASQATRITPIMVSSELLARASRIDGGLLLDPTGVCFAIGVVLDGEAHESCRPSRGARFNSAVRYVHAGRAPRMAIVYSDDRTLDVVPLLRTQVSRAKLEAALVELEAATTETYHRPRFFLREHRFYLTADQCARSNAAIERIHETPLEVGELRVPHQPLAPDPAMNDSYLA